MRYGCAGGGAGPGTGKQEARNPSQAASGAPGAREQGETLTQSVTQSLTGVLEVSGQSKSIQEQQAEISKLRLAKQRADELEKELEKARRELEEANGKVAEGTKLKGMLDKAERTMQMQVRMSHISLIPSPHLPHISDTGARVLLASLFTMFGVRLMNSRLARSSGLHTLP